jgi:PIN domain nuclease of toxin-antitoxin system
MRFLLDTHILIWLAASPERLPAGLIALLEDFGQQPVFSAVAIWEIAIKAGRRRPNFTLDPVAFRERLLANDYLELPVTGEHAAHVATLPPLHADPLDRLLVAQSLVEGFPLWTADRRVAAYHPSIHLV